MRHAALEAARLLRTRTPFAALSLVAAVLATEPVARADVTHVVQRGHTIEAIAHRYRVSVKAILEANHLKDGNHLKPGQVLVVPGVDSPKRDKTAKADAEPAGLRAAQAALAPAPQPRGHETGDVIHLVRGGEALTIHVKDAHGRIPPAALESFERAMRQGTATHPPDPRLVALIAIVSDHFGGRTIQVVSGYRPYTPTQYTPHSNHNYGRAIDFRVEGVTNEAVRDFCRTLRNAGCGYYPNSTFVHLDVRDTKAYWVDWSRPGEPPMYDRAGVAADEGTSDVPDERAAPAEDAHEAGASVQSSDGSSAPQPSPQGGSPMTSRDLLENP